MNLSSNSSFSSSKTRSSNRYNCWKSRKFAKNELVHLDNFVLRRCAFMMPFIDRIPYEYVSKRFSIALREADTLEKVWLRIYGKKGLGVTLDPILFVKVMVGVRRDTRHNTGKKKKFVEISLRDFTVELPTEASWSWWPSVSPFQRFVNAWIFCDCSEYSPLLPETFFQYHLAPIFARFKRFQTLTFNDSSVTLVAEAITKICSVEKWRPIEMRRLTFGSHDRLSPFACRLSRKNKETACLDWRIIEHFSPLLRQLHFQAFETCDENMLEKVSSSISLCKNLQKVKYGSPFPFPFRTQTEDGERIRGFQGTGYKLSYCNAPNNEKWLFHCFQNNIRLRHLSFSLNDYFYEQQNDFLLSEKFLLSPGLSTVISKLHSLTLDVRYRDPLFNDERIKKIITQLGCTMPKTGRLKIRMMISSTKSKYLESVLAAIGFWLKISNETLRYLKLRLEFEHWRGYPTEILEALQHKESTKEALTELVKEQWFDGLSVVKTVKNQTILSWRNAKIELSTSDVRDSRVVITVYD